MSHCLDHKFSFSRLLYCVGKDGQDEYVEIEYLQIPDENFICNSVVLKEGYIIHRDSGVLLQLRSQCYNTLIYICTVKEFSTNLFF